MQINKIEDKREIAMKIATEYSVEKLSVNALSLRYKRSGSWVLRMLKSVGVKIRNDSIKITEEKRQDIIKRYINKESITEIAKIHDISTTSILNIVKKEGVEKRKPGGQKKFTCNESFFENIDSHEKAQILGFLYADGNITSLNGKPSAWRTEIQYRDEEILIDIAKAVSYNGKFQYKILKNKKYVKLAIARQKMAQDLIKLGCFQNKTYLIRFPQFLKDEYIASFLYGYWLGDGWCSFSYGKGKRNNTFYFAIIGNIEFIEECKKIIELKTGIYCGIELKQSNKKIASLRMNGSNGIKFWNFIKNNIAIKIGRKIKKANSINDYFNSNVITEELIKSQKNTEYFTE